MSIVKLEEPIVPTEQEVLLAQESQRQIGSLHLKEGTEPVGLRIGEASVALSAGVARVTLTLIDQVAKGKAVAVVPLDKEVSPQEAASLLGVSRTYATKLFAKGTIPCRKVGAHWRALVRDVLAYKEENKKARLAVPDELVAKSQRLGLDSVVTRF